MLVILLAQACSPNVSENRPIAEVGIKKLYASDLNEILPQNISSDDSIRLVNEYLNKWVKQELLVQKANENLSAEEKNLNREIEEYRNSLLIYKYKNALINQRMDTVVSKAQIQEYYDENNQNFNLRQNIVKAVFIKIPKELAQPEQLKTMINDTSPEGLNELREYCLQYAKAFDFFTDNWVNFSIIRNNIPQAVDNVESFLQRNTPVEMNDSNYYYLVSILDYKLMNEQAPIEFVEANIRNLILNQRKITFLKEIEETIYSEALRENKFKIYEP